jgi:hypothetical protein
VPIVSIKTFVVMSGSGIRDAGWEMRVCHASYGLCHASYELWNASCVIPFKMVDTRLKRLAERDVNLFGVA